ncbi:MAG TPA: ribonuclease HII [Devosiaceae bacterium]
MARISPALAIANGPDLFHERAAIAAGARLVAGVDEAGRGPLAGPVVVAAVILDHGRVPDGLNDSKKLTAEKREELFALIMASAIVSVVAAPPSIIASLNIRGATLWAMRHAVINLSHRPDHVLIDGRDVPPQMPVHGQAIIDGDALSVSIAAASIIAKVTRDSMCQVMHRDAPNFGFAGHKGYSTPEHLAALDRHGPCRHHRAAFAPVVIAHAKRAAAG